MWRDGRFWPELCPDLKGTWTGEGQNGRIAWGHSFSSVAATQEPFAWAIAADGRTIVDADTDGSYFLTVQSADRMELCYTHSVLSPSKSIVATCTMVTRKR